MALHSTVYIYVKWESACFQRITHFTVQTRTTKWLYNKLPWGLFPLLGEQAELLQIIMVSCQVDWLYDLRMQLLECILCYIDVWRLHRDFSESSQFISSKVIISIRCYFLGLFCTLSNEAWCFCQNFKLLITAENLSRYRLNLETNENN